MKKTKELVISAYSNGSQNRTYDWCGSINDDVKISVYRKGLVSSILNNEIYISNNVGRDVHTFFYHLEKNYNHLPDYTFVSQDYPFDHVPNYIDIINGTDTDMDIHAKLKFEGCWFFNDDAHFRETSIIRECDIYGCPDHCGMYIERGGLNLQDAWQQLFVGEVPAPIRFCPAGHFCVTNTCVRNRSRQFYKKVVEILETNQNAPWVIERLEGYIFSNQYEDKFTKRGAGGNNVAPVTKIFDSMDAYNTSFESNHSKYIVGVCAHINSEWKLETLLRQLKELRQDGLDVCLTMNSREYLDEISPWVKYLVVDDYNELTTQGFYMQNADIMHNEEGSVWYWFTGDNWEINYRIPMWGHSPPAFRLWRNSFQMAHMNGYRWTIHTEYDLPRPLVGWRRHFDDMVREMVDTGSDAYCYKDGSGILWGTMFAVNSDIAVHPRMTDPIPYRDNTEWIRRFGTAVAEQVFLNSLMTAYGDRIVYRLLPEVRTSIWGEQSLNPSSADVGQRMNVGAGEIIHVFPHRRGEEMGLSIILMGYCEETIEDISVSYDANPVWYKDSVRLCNGCWFIDSLRPPTDSETTIRLSYSKQLNGARQTYEEFYYAKDIEKIYAYLMGAYPV